MSKVTRWMAEELEGLRRTRDELAVQASLGRAELRDLWEPLEKTWHELEGRLNVIADEALSDADDIREAARLLVDELREGYEHIKDRL